MSKITKEQKKEILERRSTGETLQSIGNDYGLSRERIRQITVNVDVPKREPKWTDEYKREYNRQYYKRPGVKEKLREYKRQYQQRPEVKERLREYHKQYYQRRKAISSKLK